METFIETIFQQQADYAPMIARTKAHRRITKLKALKTWITVHLTDIQAALKHDLGRHPAETIIGELLAVNTEIRHTCRHLASWMWPHPVPTPITSLGAPAKIRYEPKGTVLIISPWNYPFNLAILPLIQAVAAGNTVIIKPSEYAPATAGIIKQMIAEVFDSKEVTVIEGDSTVASKLVKLPFNHIYFTGSTEVGKVVMKAAAEHLTSVTLELGGKSPCIVDSSADIEAAAERIIWGKFVNTGQACIAPDYVLVHKSIQTALLNAMKASIERRYNPHQQGIQHSESYGRIVNQKHFNRLQSLLTDALDQQAQLVYGGQSDANQYYLSPTILNAVSDSMRIMQEEIFGPLLPVVTFQENSEVIQYIRKREKPLALYIFSKNSRNIRFFIHETSAGSTVINDTLIQYGNTSLPWGGVNHSGIGKSGGYFGFQEFSNARSIVRRRWGSLHFFYPPYNKRIEDLLKWAIGWI
ncbi:MAG: aldehyde dehydrogenase family protein [Siphonobacter sp.]